MTEQPNIVTTHINVNTCTLSGNLSLLGVHLESIISSYIQHLYEDLGTSMCQCVSWELSSNNSFTIKSAILWLEKKRTKNHRNVQIILERDTNWLNQQKMLSVPMFQFETQICWVANFSGKMFTCDLLTNLSARKEKKESQDKGFTVPLDSRSECHQWSVQSFCLLSPAQWW